MSAGAADEGTRVVVHEIAEAGLLLECSIRLSPGEEIELVLPDAGVKRLTVEWAGERFFGCSYAGPIPSEPPAAARAGMGALPGRGSPEAVALAAHQLHELSQAIEKISSVLDRAMDQLSKRER